MTATLQRTVVADQPAEASAAARTLNLVLAAVAIALAGLSAVIAGRASGSIRSFVLAGLVVLWAIAGANTGIRRPSDRTGMWILGSVVIGAAGLYGATTLAYAGHGGSVSESMIRYAKVLRALSLGAFVGAVAHIGLSLPTGRLERASRRTFSIICWGGGAALAAAIAIKSRSVSAWIFATAIVAAMTIGGFGVAARYHKSTLFDRRRIKWLGWAVTVCAGIGLASVVLRALVGWPGRQTDVVLAATLLIPLALILGSVKSFAAIIDKLLSQTISLGGLGAVVGAVYLGIVLGLGRVPEKNERELLVLSMIAAAVAALLYIPTRARLSRLANRLVYGERDAPEDVLRTFGSRLSRSIPLDELLLQMAESLRKTLLLDAAEVWTGSGGKLERAASDPDRGPGRLSIGASEESVVARAGVSGPAWLSVWLPSLLNGRDAAQLRVAPITHSGDLLGLIVIERRADALSFSSEDERILTELARQVGLALHNVQLDSALQASLDEVRRQAAALQASRGRIVAVADAERRRIERNLHDGAQQHLVALAVKVRLVRQLAESNPEQAKSFLEELGGDVTNALEELRNLAHGIYPPLLADRGLGEALTASATRAALPTHVASDGIGRYSPEIEAAVYFCCLEAVQNAGKYAGEGAHVTITLREDAGALVFEVADNGAGFDVGKQGIGAGFTNMSDRVGATGGSLRVESAPGKGTKVIGLVPIPGPP
ncbi:MAG: histidine kinase [Actinomycetota bacterium]|nr:histidine kinase [Actinomycetota bacterium]